MKNPRFEYLDDVIEDKDGWRRRGDFETEEDFKKGRAPKEGSATVKRWQDDERNAQAARVRQNQTDAAAADAAAAAAAAAATKVVTPSTGATPSKSGIIGSGGSSGGSSGSSGSSSS